MQRTDPTPPPLCRGGRAEEKDGRRRDGRSGRAGRAATTARAAVAMAGEGRGGLVGREGEEVKKMKVKWRGERGVWILELDGVLMREGDDEIFADVLAHPMGRILPCYWNWRPNKQPNQNFRLVFLFPNLFFSSSVAFKY